MSDTVVLLGTIGTWIGAGCAFIALVAVLPLYFLYRTSRTQQYIALHDVDDPDRKYVGRGIPLLKGKRFFRRVTVPDLRKRPDFSNLVLEPNDSVTERIASLTGWVNLGNLVKAYGIKADAGDLLEYQSNQSFLPVHRGWLLLVGLAGRYSRRADYGIKQKSEIEVEMTMFSDGALAGMTGMLCVIPKRFTDLIAGDDVDRICFRMHSQAQIQVFSGGDISLKTLFYLFLGLLPSKRGGKLFDLRIPKVVRARNSPGDFVSTPAPDPDSMIRGKPVLWKPTSEGSASASFWRQRIAFDVKLKLPVIFRIEETTVEKLPEKEAQKGWLHSGDFYFLAESESKNIWMLKSDICVIAHSFLNVRSSLQGFLLGSEMKGRDGLLHMIIDTSDLEGLLQQCSIAIGHLGVPAAKKAQLADALKKAEGEAQAKRSDRHSWSRGAMNAFSQLESMLGSVGNLDSPAMQSVVLLYTLSYEFRNSIKVEANKEEEFAQASTSTFRFDLNENSIIVPPLGEFSNLPPVKFSFDFKLFLGGNLLRKEKSMTEGRETVLLNYPTILLGCLVSQLKCAMWEMMLPGSDLLKMYNQLGRVIHISAVTTPPVRNIWSLVEEGMLEEFDRSKKTRTRTRSSSRSSSYSYSYLDESDLERPRRRMSRTVAARTVVETEDAETERAEASVDATIKNVKPKGLQSY